MPFLLALAVAALVLGCQQSPVPGASAADSLGSRTLQLRVEGDALAALGEYEAAAVKYQAAVNQAPNAVALRFALGAALSHLGRREETVEQFRFVVSRGAPGSPDYQAALQWLVGAGEAVPAGWSPEYEAAAVKYEAAVNQEPDNVAHRFALGTALSHLGRREEALEQFRFVVSRGTPGTVEYQVALRWLMSAGQVVESAASPSGFPRDASGSAGKVRGRTEWPGGSLKEEPRWVRIYLLGAEESNGGVGLVTYVKLGEPYEFDKVPPGRYRLSAQVARSPAWEQGVVVGRRQEVVLDLNSSNSLLPSMELPPPAAELAEGEQ